MMHVVSLVVVVVVVVAVVTRDTSVVVDDGVSIGSVCYQHG